MSNPWLFQIPAMNLTNVLLVIGLIVLCCLTAGKIINHGIEVAHESGQGSDLIGYFIYGLCVAVFGWFTGWVLISWFPALGSY